MFGRFKALLCTILLMSAPAILVAAPNCEGVQRLARIHDLYRALVDNDDLGKSRAAARLFPMLSERDPESFLQDLGIDTQVSRFSTALASGGNLAKAVITKPNQTPQALDHHKANISYLASLVQDSDCLSGSGYKQGAGGKFLQSAALNSQGLTSDTKSSRSDRSRQPFSVATILIAALAFATVAGAVYFLKKTRILRIRNVNRLPRSKIRLTVPIVVENPETGPQRQSASAMDASVGGMKLRLESPIPSGADVSLSLPFGERPAMVVWSNAHYAGIVFQANLSNTEFNTLFQKTKNSP